MEFVAIMVGKLSAAAARSARNLSKSLLEIASSPPVCNKIIDLVVYSKILTSIKCNIN